MNRWLRIAELSSELAYRIKGIERAEPVRFVLALAEVREAALAVAAGDADDIGRLCAVMAQAWLEVENLIPTVTLSGSDLRDMSKIAAELRKIIPRQTDRPLRSPVATRPAQVSRRTRYVTGLAVRLLPPADRARYRQEFAAELADLPRPDQAPYALRLAFRAWSLRRSLQERPAVRSTRVVVAVGFGACSAVSLATLGWPAAFLGSVVIGGLMWTISSPHRTRRLASLIRAARKR